MTREELTELIQDEDTKVMLTELGFITKESADTELELKTKGLVNKRDELLDKVTKLKDAKQKASTLDELLQLTGLSEKEEGSTALIDYFEKLKNPDEPEELRQLRRDFKELSESSAVMKQENEISMNAIKSNLVDNVIKTKLMSEGCDEIQASSAMLYILSQTKFDLITENGSRKAVNSMNMTPSEFMTEWLKSDESLKLLPARKNKGAGATGNKAGQMLDVDEDLFNSSLTYRGKIYKENRDLFDKLEVKRNKKRK